MLNQQKLQRKKNGDFKDIEIQIILDRQIRTMLNMHIIEPKHRPFHMGMINFEQHSTAIKKELHETCDFFQPLESLKGQCLADFYIHNTTQFVNHYKKT